MLKIILCFSGFTFLKTKSIENPVANNNPPATIKSKSVQLTSLVTNIAISGISKGPKEQTTIIKRRLFFIKNTFKSSIKITNKIECFWYSFKFSYILRMLFWIYSELIIDIYGVYSEFNKKF